MTTEGSRLRLPGTVCAAHLWLDTPGRMLNGARASQATPLRAVGRRAPEAGASGYGG